MQSNDFKVSNEKSGPHDPKLFDPGWYVTGIISDFQFIFVLGEAHSAVASLSPHH